MFLDDELIEMCVNVEIKCDTDVQEFYNELIRKCEDYYRLKVEVGMRKSEVKTIIDRTFNLWDSFVRMALKHENNQVRILGSLCEVHTFKKAFYQNKELMNFYLSCQL